MRTSTILIIVALAVLLVSMGVYDQQLHTAFKQGAYKIPFSNYVSTNFSGFRHINLKSASTVNVKIERGPFRTLTEPSASDFVQLKMNGDTLEIETVFPDDYRNYGAGFGMYISCPVLSSISSNAYYHIRREKHVDRFASENFRIRRTIVSGFAQDSLNVMATNASNIWLVNDTLKSLNALIGADSASASNFYIGEKNYFERTNIDVRNQARFWIHSADTTQTFHYTLTDSALLIVSASARHILKTLQ